MAAGQGIEARCWSRRWCLITLIDIIDGLGFQMPYDWIYLNPHLNCFSSDLVTPRAVHPTWTRRILEGVLRLTSFAGPIPARTGKIPSPFRPPPPPSPLTKRTAETLPPPAHHQLGLAWPGSRKGQFRTRAKFVASGPPG